MCVTGALSDEVAVPVDEDDEPVVVAAEPASLVLARPVGCCASANEPAAASKSSLSIIMGRIYYLRLARTSRVLRGTFERQTCCEVGSSNENGSKRCEAEARGSVPSFLAEWTEGISNGKDVGVASSRMRNHCNPPADNMLRSVR